MCVCVPRYTVRRALHYILRGTGVAPNYTLIVHSFGGEYTAVRKAVARVCVCEVGSSAGGAA